ncbi:MAG: ATP-binding protein, partial [Treponema sp.]|nr:ATP-binding protein [Treponema sp.]
MKMIIPALKAKLSPAEESSGNDISIKDMNILDHIEKVIEISERYDIDKCLIKGENHLNYLSAKLGISPIQAALFSHFMEKSDDNNIKLSEIANSVKCSKIRMIKYSGECEALEKKKLIRIKRDDDISYRVPASVCKSIRLHNEFKPENIENLTIDQLFSALERKFEERENKELTYNDMKLEILDLINMNKHLLFCSKIMSYTELDEDEMVLLVCFCHLFANNNDNNIRTCDIKFLYEENSEYQKIKKELSHDDHWLFTFDYISNNNSNGFVDSESWRLSDKTKKELLSELTVKGNRNYKKNLILHEKIKSKKMFYNSRETGEIEKLVSLLQEENYRKIVDRLDGKGMRKGFACLFSGGPGTGKTETAYQIARETKRNIMMVDISETKSMWYGESEKKIKEIFDTYRTAVENSEIAPILLFNEADAVIGKRKEFDFSNGSIAQTENTIQNIILQEMENLSGILIATTNLTQNMDKAFERRFLYKINFDKPSKESRRGIWNALLPDLHEDKS